MKTIKYAWLAGLAAASLLLAGSSEAQTNFTGTVTVNQNIPDGNPVGLVSQTTFSGLTGTISSMSLNLDITGGYNGDLYAYLVGPNSTTLVLLNRVGLSSANDFGYSDSGFNITLTNGASDLHFYQAGSYTLSGGQLIGSWAPDGATISPNSAGSAYDGTTAGNFNLFNNTDPNGEWTLFVADLANGGGQSMIVDWSLTIVTDVPEPQTWALMIGGVGALLALRRRKV